MPSLNLHFHMLALDGVFTEHPDGAVRFHWKRSCKPAASRSRIATARAVASVRHPCEFSPMPDDRDAADFDDSFHLRCQDGLGMTVTERLNLRADLGACEEGYGLYVGIAEAF